MNDLMDEWVALDWEHRLGYRADTFGAALFLLARKQHRLIVETGTIRIPSGQKLGVTDGNLPSEFKRKVDIKSLRNGEGDSTLLFGEFCSRYLPCGLVTIDINPEHLKISQEVTRDYAKYITYVQGNSVDVLLKIDASIDLLYLDSMDCDPFRDSTPAQEHQKAELCAAYNKLAHDAIVLLDDSSFDNGGKTKLAREVLKDRGWTELMHKYQSLWVRKI